MLDRAVLPPGPAVSTRALGSSATLDVVAAYDEHADFVWKSLHRLGVRAADLPDLVQEVFLVVHRRRAEHDGERSVRGWLFGIATGLVRNYRRRAFRRLEQSVDAGPEPRADGNPEEALVTRRRRERGERALSELDPEKRAVFVMFEVEGMSGREIAALLDVPLGTVHSRLHGARRELARALAGDAGEDDAGTNASRSSDADRGDEE